VAESFLGTLKSEWVHWVSYQTREEAHRDIAEYITMFYNCRRLHSSLGYRSSNKFEKNGHMANAT
jgi:putative transposase